MDILQVVILSGVASVVLLSLTFLLARARDRYDLIDVVWGLAFIAVALTSYLTQAEISFVSIQTLATVLVIIWGLRLAVHIYTRWRASASEDRRYVDMRHEYASKAGGPTINMFVRVYIVQALLATIVSSSIIVINASSSKEIGVVAAIGLVVWIIGFLFESIGDAQLRKHLATPSMKGKLMTSGLWQYTRHPNYFGEMTLWWGIFIIALSVPFWWLSIIGPIVITVLLMFISGVPLTEKHFEGRDGWDEYKKRTSKVFPFPPRS